MSDERKRCPWAGDDPLMRAYHDTEWGVPEHDDRALFEKLLLDGFQAGLSWRTILHKRENFRRAFDGFQPERIARYSPARVEKLMGDAGIVRNRAKIESSVASARAWLKLRDEGVRFSEFLWQLGGGAPTVNLWRKSSQVPAETPASRALSKALKARGFNFVGPTICYAFMQAVGMVDDHLVDCFRRDAQAASGRHGVGHGSRAHRRLTPTPS